IDDVIAISGGSRSVANLTYIADRRIEVLAHAFQRHPTVLVELRRANHVLAPEEPSRTARDAICWLVGVAFGRWDVRGPRVHAFDPFGLIPLRAPAMLVPDARVPGSGAPAGYPVVIAADGILLDEAGHTLDVEARVMDAA